MGEQDRTQRGPPPGAARPEHPYGPQAMFPGPRPLPVAGLSHLRAPLRLSWKQLYCQFGAHPAKSSDKVTVQNFRIKVLRELKKIKLAWPELNYATAPGVLILHPSKPSIPNRQSNFSLWNNRGYDSRHDLFGGPESAPGPKAGVTSVAPTSFSLLPSYRNPFGDITQNKYYVGEKKGPGTTTCFDTGNTF